MSRILAVSNQKGGVGKTTSCVSLGACLAELGHPTLIVDLDPQAHLTMACGLDPEELEFTNVDLIDPDTEDVGVSRMGSIIVQTGFERLDVLPTDQRLAELEFTLHDHPGYEQILANVFEPLSSKYDYILIDCPPSMGALTIIALTAADTALIPVQCDYFATRGLMRLLDIIEAVRQRTNPGLCYALFVTMYDARPLISRRVLEQLRANFSDEIFDSVIGLDTRLRESVMANEPVISYATKTRASSQYRKLAAELIRRIETRGTTE
jgi:chromosome partitioning protein